jgi:putative membrane protein
VFNPQAFIEFLCYIIFSLVILHLVISGEYLSYVTPRMKPYLIFTSIAMAVWACIELRRLFNPQHKLRAAHCFVLVLPVLLMILPHKPISASELSSGYVNMNTLNNIASKNSNSKLTSQILSTTPTISPLEDSSSANENTDFADNQSSNINHSTPVTEEELSDSFLNGKSSNKSDASATDEQNILQDDELALTLSGFDKINKKITISDAEFYPWLNEIFTNMNKFDGYQITIKGFVFKDDPELKNNEFVASRLLMSCCAADLVPCGIVCQYDQISELEADAWITVEGVMHIGKYLGNDEPQITVKNISVAEKPDDEYIYQY